MGPGSRATARKCAEALGRDDSEVVKFVPSDLQFAYEALSGVVMARINIRRLARCSLVLLVAFAFSPSSSRATPETTEAITNYAGADRQAVLEAGARREAQLQIYAIGTQADPLYAAFGRRYPFIRVAAFRADSTYVVRRMMEEYGAARYLADAIDLSTGALHQMLDADLLRSFTSPELPKFR